MELDIFRKVVSEDRETKKLKVEDSDLLLVYNYIQIRDQKMASKIKDGFEVKLVTEPYYQIIEVAKKEYLGSLKRKEKMSLVDTLGIDNYIQDADLDSFNVSTEERKKAYSYALEFISSYQNEKIQSGMYLRGQYRTGKSYLLSAIALKLVEIGATVLFVYCPDLVRVLKDGMHDGSLEKKVKALKTCDVLFLDDFGAENMSSWYRDEILCPVLQYRLSAKLPVFISSNSDLSQLLPVLSDTKDDTDRIKSLGIINRIQELTKDFKISSWLYKSA